MKNLFKINEDFSEYLEILSNISVPFIIIDSNDFIIETNNSAIAMFETIYISNKIKILNNDFKNILWFIKDEFLSFKNKKESSHNFFKEITISNIDWKFYGEFLKIDDKILLILNYHLAKLDSIKKALQLSSIIDSCEDSIIATDLDGNIISWNKASEKIYGYTKKEILKRNISIINIENPDKTIPELLNKIKSGKEIKNFEVKILNKNNTKIFLSINISPIKNHIGTIIGACAISRDISEIIKNEEKLIQAKIIAEEANNAKSSFLATMSHEIRTPINGIMGMTDLALMTELTDEQEEYLNMIKISSKHLLDIIKDILDIAKIESGKFKLELESFNLEETINKIAKNFSVLANEKFIQVLYFVDPSLTDINIVGDPLRLSQIIMNLMNNALKFTEKGTITVCAKKVQGPEGKIKVQFSISDTGIGISEDKINRLFKTFSQADDTYRKKYGGTGLGLAISQNLVNMMNGDIWVTSKKDNGSCFYFTAEFFTNDIYSSFLSKNIETNLSNVELENKKDISITTKSNENSINKTQVNITDYNPTKTILIVEDNEIHQQFISKLLYKKGYSYINAFNGTEALKILEERKIDLILMDIHMPKLNGLHTTNAIRCKENLKGVHIPIIAMTAYAMVGDKENFLAYGMDDYISKPIDFKNLYGVLDKYL